MNINEQLISLGVPAELFGWNEEIGSYALKAKFIKWCGHQNPTQFEQDNLREGDIVPAVSVVTTGPYGSSQRRSLDVLTKRGIRRTLFKAKNPVAVEYTDRILDILDEYDKGAALNEGALRRDRKARAWVRARLDGIEARKTFTDVLKEAYDAHGSSQPFSIWASTYTKMIAKGSLGVSEQEFNERRKAAGGNFRDAATEEELRLLDAAESHIAALAAFRRSYDIKALYHEAKASLQALTAA